MIFPIMKYVIYDRSLYGSISQNGTQTHYNNCVGVWVTHTHINPLESVGG